MRGLVISFLLVFPFTFLPTIIRSGWKLRPIIERIPESTLYAFLFSCFVVAAAVLQNYHSLVDRKRLFDKPAFKKLDFIGRLDGLGSVVSELETFLLGKIDMYYYRISILDPDLKKFKIGIIPLIDYTDAPELKAILKKKYSFKDGLLPARYVSLEEQDLEDEDFLLNRLIILEQLLKDLGAPKLDIDEDDLDD